MSQTDAHNPGDQQYEQDFGFEHEREQARANSSTEQASTGTDQPQTWSRDGRSVAEREAAPSWDTNVSGGGPYTDTVLSVEFYWAASELNITTGKTA